MSQLKEVGAIQIGFWYVPNVKIKTPTSFYPLRKASNSRDGNYSFEFFSLHAAHA